MDEHSIFAEALECESNQARVEYLRVACGDDDALRKRVSRLLQLHEDADEFLEKPVMPPNPPGAVSEAPGSRIGPYKLLEQIGEGGMGVVYMAAQQEPVRRRVAVKIIKPGMDTKQVIARFEAERQALALMEHENIARVLDAGATDSGRPYFVMELVRGVPITDYCQRERLEAEQRLRLFVDVCHAVQHAHQKGIIHRDIKPSNVMITLHDGEPVVKMIDFGVAKATNQQLTDRTLFTNYAQMIGTPLYMSPEQAEMSGLDVDTRSDIYSLGVLLYELLTDTTPFEKERLKEVGYDEMRRIICEEDPPKPSTRLSTVGAAQDTISDKRRADARRMSQALRGELDWIVVRALEKNRVRRYQTAKDFADDVQRYLKGEPVEACPPSVGYLARKFFGKHQGIVATVGAIGLLLVIGTIAATSLAVRASRAEKDAERARASAEEEAAVATAISEFLREELLGQASPYENPNRNLRLREVLDRASERIEGHFDGPPLVEAEIRVTLGTTYYHLGEYEESAKHFDRAYEICVAELGEEHPRTLKVASQRAYYLSATAGTNASLLALEETLKLQRSVLPPDHPDTLLTMSWLGWRYVSRSRFDEASEIFDRALTGMRRVFGADHPDTLDCLDSLARMYSYQDRHEESEELHQKVLAARRRVLGEFHPQCQDSLSAIADLKMLAGETDEAIEIYDRVLELRRRVQGESHPTTLANQRMAARALHKVHALEAAEKRYVETLKGHRERYGESHRHTRYTMQLLASLYERQGRFQSALPLRKALLEYRRRTYGNDHRLTITGIRNLASVYLNLDQFDEAERLHQEILSTQKRVHGEDDPRTLDALSRLAYGYQQATQLEDAERIAKDLIRQRTRVQGADHPDTLNSVLKLGFIYKIGRRYKEAEGQFREAWTKGPEAWGADHFRTLSAGLNLGLCMRRQGRAEEAEAIHRDALDKSLARYGDDHITTAESLEELAETWRYLHRWEASAELTDRAVSVRRKVQGASHDQTFHAIGRLADLAVVVENCGDQQAARSIKERVNRQIEEILESHHEHFGDQHENTLHAMHKVSELYIRQRRLEEARKLRREILETRKQLDGLDDQRTLNAARHLAYVLQHDKKYDEAALVIRDTIERQTRLSGKDDPHTLRHRMRLGYIYRSQGKLDEAEEIFAELHGKFADVVGPEKKETLNAGALLSAVLRQQGRLEEAETLCKTVLETRKRVLGEPHKDTLRSMRDLARIYAKADRLEEARELRLHTIELLRAAQGDTHAETLNAIVGLHGIATLYGRRGDLKASVSVRRQVHELYAEILGETATKTLKVLASLPVAYRRLGDWSGMYEASKRLIELRSDTKVQKYPPYYAMLWNTEALVKLKRLDEAEQRIRKCLELWEESGSDEPGPFASYSIGAVLVHDELSKVLIAQEKYEDAEAALLKCRASLEQLDDLAPWQQRRVAGRLVALYEAWDKQDEADRWRAEADAADQSSSSPSSTSSD